MLAHPPNTFWQDATCSLAEPSPGFTAKIVLPIPIFSLVISVYFVWIASITGANSVSASTGFLSASTASCAALTSFARPTYAGSFLERANSASPSGLER